MSDPGTCPNCGSPVSPDDRFCQNCGAEITTASGSPSFVVATSNPNASALVPYQGSDPPLNFDIDYPDTLSRWKIFVKWLLAIPHMIILYFLGIAIVFVVIIAWFAILITGRYPRELWDFALMYLRWYGNVYAYIWLQRDEYPPFAAEPYPAQITFEYPERLSRWLIFVKWLLVIPSAFVFAFILLAAVVAAFIGFFAILITGRMPRGIFDFITGMHRWYYRMIAYLYLMTDRYPPFSLD